MSKKRTDAEYLKECTTLEPAAIDEEFSRLPNDYAYWNERYSEANERFLRAEHFEEQVNSRVYLTKRETPEEPEVEGDKKKKEKKLTESAIDALVKTDPEMIAATSARITAEVEKDYLRGVLETMRTKRESLVSLAANMRQEQKANPNMNMENLTGGFNG